MRSLADLLRDWIDRESLTQSIGIEWRRTNRALGLWVPSAVEPGENNIVLNPDHMSFASITVSVERNPFSFDDRIFS
ncbi:hypothetical protein H6CHR_02571 [Variovorax sp. PBL-H6]|uniref:RES family NAD+ phosphorylase n=1 Tax=Variovorax sp. PBL-H6 TaxID=434009 RepID=UPI001315C29C|nr:RES family NAD+ phosphorylase [Variovorax sp. PBL-H6]VTU26322.1 hypothetical protein H6CHR_02571 [Variovorax sp. PBL-H6]